ncbi:MAG: oligosaccharide flippase family protein [Candidatus Methanomethylophilaceae archaeon]
MLVHKYMMKAISNIVAAVSSFVALMVMTRYVSYEYGVMMWGFAFVALFNIVTGLGFDTAHIKFIAEGRNQNDCFSTYTIIRLLLTLLMVIFSIAAVIIGLHNESMDAEAAKVVAVFITSYTVLNIRTIITTTFDARLESGKSSIIIVAESIVRSVLLIILALKQVSADVLSTSYLISTVVTIIPTLLFTKNVGLKFTRPTLFKEYAIFAAPLILSSLVLGSVDSLDKVIIGFSGTPLEVSYYAAAMGAVVAMVSLGVSMNNVILPQLSSPEMISSRSKTEKLVWASQKYLMMFLLPVTAVLIVYGEEIASVLFGSDFSKAGIILSILSVMMTLKILSGVLSQVLYASNNGRLYTRASVAYGISVIVMFLLFIPASSPFPWTEGIGAAIAATLGSIFYTIVLTYYVKRSTGVRVYSELWKHLLATAITIAVLVFASCYFGGVGILWVIIVSLLGLGVHLAVLYATGEFRKSDVVFFLNAINPKQIYESLEDELQ